MLAAALGWSASPAAAETTLEATTPADGRYRPGAPTPIIVTIRSDGAVAGSLTVAFDGASAGSQRVEVPGGSVKEIIMIVPTPPWSGSMATVSFEADGDGDDATARLALSVAGGDEVIAVLPELAARNVPGSASLVVDLGVARFFPFDPALLDVGSDALSPFTQVVATSGDLEALDNGQRLALESWVAASGGVLIVDEPAGSPLPFDLHTRSITLDADSLAFGLGTIGYGGGRAAAGAYDGLFGPTRSPSPDEFPWGGGWGGAPTVTLLAADAGIRVPAIGAVLGLIALYGVVAGPVLWLVLRRSRREPLLWVALPAVALVATLGVWVAGRAMRENQSSAHATLVADLPTLRLTSSQVLVTSANGGSAGIELPPGWRQASTSGQEAFFGGPFGSPNMTNGGVVRGNQLVTELPPGGFGVLAAERTSGGNPPSWAFDVRAEEDRLVGTVTNLSGHDLTNVSVFSGQGFALVRSLEAGGSAEVTLRNVTTPPLDNDPLMNELFRNDPWSANDGPVNPGLLTNFLAGRPGLRDPGMIVAVGWTRDAVGPLNSGGGAIVDRGRTAFLAAERLDPEVLAPAGRIEFLRGWNSVRITDPVGANQCGDAPLAVALTSGPDLDPAQAVLEVRRRAIAAFDVWDGDIWLPAGMGSAAGDVVVALQPGALADDGKTYVRMTMSCEFWGMPNPFPILRNAAAADTVVALGELGSDPPRPADSPPPTSAPPTTATIPPTTAPPAAPSGGGETTTEAADA